MTILTCNDEQVAALYAINHWLDATGEYSPYFVLSGSAGTGKTFCIRELVSTRKGEYAFTATTNKATKELKASVYTDTYQPECRTIYSLLGLTMSTDGEVKEIRATEKRLEISRFDAIIVDEASMVSKQLMKHIENAIARYNTRFIFMGDRAQLPPIGEYESPVWEIATGVTLTKVMRHDNAILEFATRLRAEVDKDIPSIKIEGTMPKEADISDLSHEGIWKLGKTDFESVLLAQAREQQFSAYGMAKVVAWRNVRVDYFNKLIRDATFGKLTQDLPTWLEDDRLIFTAPVIDVHENMVATTDDEGSVVDVGIGSINGFKTWDLEVQLDDGRMIVANAIHEDSLQAYNSLLSVFAEEAKRRERKWKDFWKLKELFNGVRYAYALTAHRSQGSTYDRTFVCWQDILRNQDLNEAYRCLYVASTRPRRALVFS